MSFMFSKSKFEEDVERATSELAPMGSEDLELSLDIADMIKSKSVAPKEALRVFKKRLGHQNPNVQLMVLKLLDICVKNGGNHFLVEVASVEFMEFYAETAMGDHLNAKVGQAMMDYLANWASATMISPNMGPIYSTYARMKRFGNWNAPDINAGSALLDTVTAPDWTDSDVCERCRTAFTVTNRKHHCRACGRTFCQSCSSKTMPLLNLGIKEAVRVCDGCYARKGVPPKRSDSSQSPVPSGKPLVSRKPTSPSKEDEDIALAIKLSLQEQKQKSPKRSGGDPNYFAPRKPREATPPPANDEESDEEIKKAIAASLADMSGALQGPLKDSAPTNKSSRPPPAKSEPERSQKSSTHLTDTEIENIELFAKLVSNLEKGAETAQNAPHNRELLDLYHQIITLHPKLYNELQATLNRWQALDKLQRKMNDAIQRYDDKIQEKLRSLHAPAVDQHRPMMAGSYGSSTEPSTGGGYYTTQSAPYHLGVVPPTPSQAPIHTEVRHAGDIGWDPYQAASVAQAGAPLGPPSQSLPPPGQPPYQTAPPQSPDTSMQGYYAGAAPTGPVMPAYGVVPGPPGYGQAPPPEPPAQEAKPPVQEAPPLIEL